MKRLVAKRELNEQKIIEWIMEDYDTDEKNARSIWKSIYDEIVDTLDRGATRENLERVEEIVEDELSGIDYALVAPLLIPEVTAVDYSKYKGPF